MSLLSLWFNALAKYLVGGLSIACLVLLAWGMRVNDLRDRWHHQYTAEHAGRLADRAAYEQAQKDAAAANRAEVARKEAQSKRITDDAKSAYERDLAKLRADRVRQQAAPATPGSAGQAGTPQDGPTASRADADGLRLSPDERLQASEIELRLMHLQSWIMRQLELDESGGKDAAPQQPAR